MPDLVRSRCSVWRWKSDITLLSQWWVYEDGPPPREAWQTNYHEWSDRKGGLTKGARCLHCRLTLAETMRPADEVYGVDEGSDEHLARALRTGT